VRPNDRPSSGACALEADGAKLRKRFSIRLEPSWRRKVPTLRETVVNQVGDQINNERIRDLKTALVGGA